MIRCVLFSANVFSLLCRTKQALVASFHALVGWLTMVGIAFTSKNDTASIQGRLFSSRGLGSKPLWQYDKTNVLVLQLGKDVDAWL